MRSPLSLLLSLLLSGAAADARAQPAVAIDLAEVSTDSGVLRRVHGSEGDGSLGVPVAGGLDVDGDANGDPGGDPDIAFASMRATPLGRSGAGKVYLSFGDGTVAGTFDTAVSQARILVFYGDVDFEAAGSELWMDDVSGDGFADLLIARQNFTPEVGREGAGALTLVMGGPELRAHAATLQPVDLRSPPAALTLATFVGPHQTSRLGIWMRTGDVTGDGIADIVVGADQQLGAGFTHRGAAYLIRGGAHLAADQTIDLIDFGSTPLAGDIAQLLPPSSPNPSHFHFGATCQIADLDANGRAEVLVAAALNRSGASIAPAGAPLGSTHATGGSQDGTLYIAWDDNFTDPWPAGLSFEIGAGPGSHTIIDGGDDHREFGEELLGGLDWDDDGTPDLFVGDLTGDFSGVRPNSGVGHVFYDAARLVGLDFDFDDLAMQTPALTAATFMGSAQGNIAADTAGQGDFDGDGLADLAFSSPHDDPLGRSDAGTVHIFHGQSGAWPALVDLASPPAFPALRLTEVYGAEGDGGGSAGDMLSYSAAVGDLDGDGRIDLITNEMTGDGIPPSPEDVGNLIVISGALLTGVPRADVPALPTWGGLPAALALAALGVRRLRAH